MACGLPAITSIFAGVAELLATEVDAFVLHDPNDVEALAQLLQRLYADEPLRNRISEAAVLAARRCTWDRNAADIWELLKFAAEKKVAGTNSVG
jgi:glycosyltransferase involved in cell wall biosynthesis